MKETERNLLRVIDTGPVGHRELTSAAPALINDELDNATIQSSQIPPMIDSLKSQGYVGETGSRLDVIVVSKLGQDVLTLD